MTRTVRRPIKRRSPTREDSRGTPSTATTARSTISPLSLRSPTVQPKLTVNSPGDRYEREADAVAQQVMNHPTPQSASTSGPASVQRMTLEAEPVQRMTEDDQDVLQRQALDVAPVQRMTAEDQDVLQRQTLEEEPLQRQGDGRPAVSSRTAATIRHPGAGSPLPASTRRRIEPHVGANLSGVRVHTDPQAHRAASSLQARAFTHGQHIFLNRGESSHNLGLMAHEATHVVQQGAATPLRPTAAPVSAPGRCEDCRAEEATAAPATASGAPRLQRSLLDDLQSGVSDLIETGTDFVNDLVGGGATASGTGSAASVVIPIPDIPLIDQRCFNLPWSGSTGRLPFYVDTIDIPHVGPVVITLYTQGNAIANLSACFGPALLRNISVTLDPLASRYLGTAQLHVPAGIIAASTLTGILGGLAEWGGLIELGNVEGALIASGSGGVTTALIATAEVIYDRGNVSFSLGTELDTCIVLTFNLNAQAMASLLSHPVWRGHWSLAAWNYQHCWRLGASISISLRGGVPSISIDVNAEDLPVADLLPQLLAESGFLGGLTPASPVPVTIAGGSELWWFNGERPPTYPLEQALTASAGGIPGTFRWSIISGLPFADFNGFPTAVGPHARVTSKSPSGSKDDVEVKVEFTGAAGETGVATKKFSVLAPDRLIFLRNDDRPSAPWVYETFVHYSIPDQFGTILPRNVPINEQWTGGLVADFAGMNWRRGAEGSATISPTDWNDWIGGEAAGGAWVPTPVVPTDPNAGVAVYHWPGRWQVGSLTIGSGRTVANVTWQKYRGRARHT
jgi:hypothetical protein